MMTSGYIIAICTNMLSMVYQQIDWLRPHYRVDLHIKMENVVTILKKYGPYFVFLRLKCLWVSVWTPQSIVQ